MNHKTMSCAEIERQLREASDAYYNGTPIMDDDEFDFVWQSHTENRRLLPDDPTWQDTILDRVGAPTRESGFRKVAHAAPMLSLDNVFEAEDGGCEALIKWIDNVKRLYGGDVVICAEPKIDGLSLELVYENGILVDAITRGDGTIGESVIQNVTPLMRIPLSIIPDKPWDGAGSYDHAVGIVFVRGEVYMPLDKFEALNAELVKDGKKPMANPRNAAAGALRLHDPNESIKRGLKFLAYNTSGWLTVSTMHSADMDRLAALGFQVPTRCQFATDNAPMISEIRQSILQGLNFATDGLVFKVNHYQIQRGMGETSRAPRWAIAYKFQQQKVVTKLLGITIQVGRSGALTPVAELEPVQVDGSVVSRATLHNEDQVCRLGLRIGDQVEVYKAGGVIPAIARSITYEMAMEHLEELQDAEFMAKMEGTDAEYSEAVEAEMLAESAEDFTEFSLLDHINHRCPACASSDIVRREEGASVYYCQNPGCPATLASRIQHMCSRAALDIEGLGEEACNAIAECNITSPLELFDWKHHDFADLSWTTEAGGKMTFGDKRAEKVIASLHGAAKSLPLNRWLVALGIPTIGVNTSKEISRLFRSAEHLQCLLFDDCDEHVAHAIRNRYDPAPTEFYADLAKYQISGRLGPDSSRKLTDWVRGEGHTILQQLALWGVKSDNYAPIPVITEGLLTGKSFCVTGTLSVPRDQIHQLIQDNGGTVVSGVSAKTSYLVAGDKAGSKIQKAEKLGITVLSESELKELIEG